MSKKQISNLIIALICVIIGIVEFILIYDHVPLWLSFSLGIIFAVIIFTLIISIVKKRDSLYRLSLMVLYGGIFCVTCYTALVFTGVLDKFESTESILIFINDEPMGAILFVILSFLQVTFIPLPSAVVAAAGTLIFGFWKGLLLSLIGQVSGSILAFLLGRKYGVKLVIWIIGEEAYEKYQNYAKGRDKAVLGFMILFPSFPDDIICLLMGLTNMKTLSFIILMLISRPISIGSTGLFTKYAQIVLSSGMLGVFAISLLCIVGAVLLILSWKYGQQIEIFMLKIMEKLIPKKFRKPAVAEIPSNNNSSDDSEEENIKNDIK